jgi:hypothetical protein
MHCNMGCIPRPLAATEEAPPSAPCSDPTQILRRLVSYVCMMEDPRDAALTKQRREFFEAGKTTAHQPDVLRWVGDRFKPHLVEKGVLCLTIDALPEGGAELL